MLCVLILFLLKGTLQSQQNQPKRYSIRQDTKSQIQFPFSDVFHIKILNISESQTPIEADSQEFQQAHFCSVLLPTIQFELKSYATLCQANCSILANAQRIYVLNQDGFLRLYSYDEQPFQNISEFLVPLHHINPKNFFMNMLEPDKLLFIQNLSVVRVQFIFEENNIEKINYTNQLDTQLDSIQSVHYLGDYLYLYGNGIIEVLQAWNEDITHTTTLNLNDANQEILENLAEPKFARQRVQGLCVKSMTVIVAYSSNILFFYMIGDNRIVSTETLIIEGAIRALVCDSTSLIVEQYVERRSWLLEIQGIRVIQNITMSFAHSAIYTTRKYFVVLSENIASVGYSNVEQPQVLQKALLESTQEILYYKSEHFVTRYEGDLFIYQLVKEKLIIECEPVKNSSTGQYKMQMEVGYFKNHTKTIENITIELYVFREIFKHSNQGLYAGLAIGLLLTFLTLSIFMYYWLQLKRHYFRAFTNVEQELSLTNQEL